MKKTTMEPQSNSYTKIKASSSFFSNMNFQEPDDPIFHEETPFSSYQQEGGTILNIPRLASDGDFMLPSSESSQELNSPTESFLLPQTQTFRNIENNSNKLSKDTISSTNSNLCTTLLTENSRDINLVGTIQNHDHTKNIQNYNISIKASSSRRKANVPKRKIPRKDIQLDKTLIEKEVEKYLLKVPSFHEYYTEIQTQPNLETDPLSMTSCQTFDENETDFDNPNADFDYIMGDNSEYEMDDTELSPLQHDKIQESISINQKNGMTDKHKGLVTNNQNKVEANKDFQNEMETDMKLQAEIQTNLELQNEIKAKFVSQNLKIPTVIPKSNGGSEKSKPKRVMCELCNKTFGRPSELKRHSVLHTGEKRHTCEDCQKNFSQRYHLIRHVKNVHKKELENLVCGVCSETFNSEYLLVRHVKRHGIMTFSCDVCNKEFKTKRQMKEHVQSLHAGIKPFHCTQCDKVFSRKYHLDRHVMVHTGVRDYQCEYCGKEFSTKGNLLAHVKRVHLKVKEFTCGVCDKRFFSPKDLQTHLKQHTGEKPHQCDICMKQFSEKVNMEWHLRIHSGERPYQCDICEKSYTRMPHLIRHKREGLCARIHSTYWKNVRTSLLSESNTETRYEYSHSSEYNDDEMENFENKISDSDDSCTSGSENESDDFGQQLSNSVESKGVNYTL